jgi:hypothetical protein
MALVLRNTKGSPLTFAEGDANLVYLESLASSGSNININSLVTTSSFNNFTGSILTTSSFNTYTGSSSSQFAGTASYALFAANGGGGGNIDTGSLATTGSNTFNGNQIISGSFTVITGSSIELQVINTGVRIGSVITDAHTVTGSLRISGSTTITGSLNVTGPSSTINNLLITSSAGTTILSATTNSLDINLTSAGTNSNGFRIYASNTLTETPNAAAIQFFSIGHPLYPGQFYLDSGADNNAALIFRTAVTSGTITERMRITADGNTLITGSLSVSGSIGHDYNQFKTLYTSVGTQTSGVILTFDPTQYYSCFIEYHVFLYDDQLPIVTTTRAGNIKISVPYKPDTNDNQYNIPFTENTTEHRTHLDYSTVTTEDIYFKVNYDSNVGLIQLIMYNDNGTYASYINAEYRLIGYRL